MRKSPRALPEPGKHRGRGGQRDQGGSRFSALKCALEFRIPRDAGWLGKTWWKWTQAPAPAWWPQAQHAQDFMESVIITLAKLGSRGRQSKLSTVVATGAPSLGVQPQEPTGHCQAGAGHTIPPLCTGMGEEGRRGTAPTCRPQAPSSGSAVLPPCPIPCAQHEMGTGKSSAALLLGGIFPGRNALPPLLGFMTSCMTFGVLRFEGAIDHYIVLPADIHLGNGCSKNIFLYRPRSPNLPSS